MSHCSYRYVLQNHSCLMMTQLVEHYPRWYKRLGCWNKVVVIIYQHAVTVLDNCFDVRDSMRNNSYNLIMMLFTQPEIIIFKVLSTFGLLKEISTNSVRTRKLNGWTRDLNPQLGVQVPV